MTIEEAKAALGEGKKVSHALFTEDEYIQLIDFTLCDENFFPLIDFEFWNSRNTTRWQTGWFIVK